MARCYSLVSVTCMLMLFSIALAENMYMVTFPKYIRPGFDLTFSVAMLDNAPNNVEFNSIFRSMDDEVQFESSINIQQGESTTVNMGTFPQEYNGVQSFTLEINGYNGGELLFTNSTSDFEYASKSLTILIQTDKAIYKPGQEIKFRGVCLSPDLRPLDGSVKYTVQDPKGNVLMMENNVELENGVAGGQFSLHENAQPGEYKIMFETRGYKKEMPVTVKMYKLPKFKVEIEAPQYVHEASPGVDIALKATYTYGKPVKGVARFTIQMQRIWEDGYWYDMPYYGGFPEENQLEITRQEFDGEENVFVSAEQLREFGAWGEDNQQYTMSVYGEVEEEFTGITFNDTTEVQVEETNIDVKVQYKPETVKPGLQYKAYIQVTEKDGKPLMQVDMDNNDLIVEVIYTYPYAGYVDRVYDPWNPFADGPEETTMSTTTTESYNRKNPEEMYVFPINANGWVEFSFQPRDDDFQSVTFKPYTNSTEKLSDRYENEWKAAAAQSPSNSFIQINSNQDDIEPLKEAFFNIKTTEEVNNIRMMVMSRGQLMRDETISTGQESNSHEFSFDVDYNMTPNVKIIATYVRSDGEIVADYVSFPVSLRLENQVSMTASDDNVDAGDDVTINVQTSAGAYVGARAIDQSVLLLKSGNDITQDRVVNDMQSYSTKEENDYYGGWMSWWWWPVPTGADTSSKVFEDADMLVMTDAFMYYDKPAIYPYYERVVADSVSGQTGQNRQRNKGSSQNNIQKVQRNYFPETWLWDDVMSGEDGSASFELTAPDTITSWVLSVFSVSDENGLGLTDPLKVTVFRKFFVNLNLPVKVTRGEIIIMQAVVFNYFDTDMKVDLKFDQNDKFDLIVPGDNGMIAGPNRVFVVKANSAYSVKFPVRMHTVGDVKFTVKAASPLAGDAITRSVYVRPEGMQQCYSTSALINLERNRKSTQFDYFDVTFPKQMIPDSGSVQMHVYGDIMRSTASNLGSLMREPTGCGEQNMLSFAPDVFISLYLENNGMMDADTRNTAYQHFIQGYQNQLNYKHDDGSYSAFGDSDDSGSTWLTAFVAKCFMFSGQMRNEFQEQLSQNIHDALNFLVDQQREDGSFNEPGKVSHKAMQGGVNSNMTMTAYVLITFRETVFANKNERYTQAAEKAQQYLEQRLADIDPQDVYTMSIVTYALNLVGSDYANQALRIFESMATKMQDGKMYWQEPEDRSSKFGKEFTPPYYQANSKDVEMTSYALLTYAGLGDTKRAYPVMQWLISKRNGLGAYSSTQNTVMAVQALTEAAKRFNDNRDLNVKVTARGVSVSQTETVEIDNDNAIVYNTIDLPAKDSRIQVATDGFGAAVAQLTVCYNVPETPYEDQGFKCQQDVQTKGMDYANINFCCRLKTGDNKTTGMFVFEMEMPSGFTADMYESSQRNKDAMRVEFVDGKANVYYDELAPDQLLCADIALVRESDVAAVQKSSALAFDYYQPQMRTFKKMFSIEEFQDTNACSICGFECTGCPKPILTDWEEVKACTSLCDVDETSTWTRYCIDPSKNVKVSASYCNLESYPEQQRECGQKMPYCPNFSNGLWGDAPYLEMNDKKPGFYAFEDSCRRFEGNQYVPKASSKNERSGIPATYLGKYVPRVSNYRNAPFIQCKYNDQLLSDVRNTGFTLSFMIFVKSFTRFPDPAYKWTIAKQHLVTFGEKNKPPVYQLAKHFKRNELIFRVRSKNQVYSVSRINSDQFVNQWTHVTMTFDPKRGGDGARFYINGERVGKSMKYFVGVQKKSTKNFEFLLGKSNYEPVRTQGGVNAWYSSLNFWNRSMKQSEVGDTYQFYSNLMDNKGDDVMMSAAQWRLFAKEGTQKCYNQKASLKDVMNYVFRYCSKMESAAY